MIRLTPPCSRTNRIVFVLGIVCLAILADVIFVAARNNDDVPFVTISGQVTNNTVGLPGVTITLSGSQIGIRTTDSNGLYSFDVPSGGNYTLTPLATGFTFDPPGYTFINLTTPRVGNFAVSAQSFVVTNVNDDGIGSFREAITNANAKPGNDTIIFNIPGPGVKVIGLLTPLPEITGPVILDASTQPGYAGAPLIELDGVNAGSEANGLVITSGGSFVRGLAIGGFQGAGIVLRSGKGNSIQGNYIGVDATGTVARPNTIGIQIPDSKKNLIGGDTAGAGNLISGNGRGIFMQIAAQENTIQGNLIGTDLTGTHKIGNGTGIHAQVAFTLIGGLTPGARNVISGNGTGVIFGEPQSKLQGNFIGTDITGTVALGNTSSGVIVDQGGLIGGNVPEARNVISGNGSSNISMGSWFVDLPAPILNTVQGNYIGTDVTGSRALIDPDLSTTKSGIFIFGSRNVVGARNVISGNVVGIRIGSILATLSGGNSIDGNLIGLNAAGTEPVPNTKGGIDLSLAIGNQIGSNTIAFNGGPGVTVSSGSSGNSIVNNSIFSNDGLGIDLGNDGVTANDPVDADAGSNNRQNFPVLSSVVSASNSTTIHGSLNSTPNTTFRIDFYSSAALDPSGNGEGALFLGTQSVTTNGNGDAIMIPTFPVALGTGRVVTATATDPSGNTSEFSAGDITSAGGTLQFSVSSIQVIEDLGVLNLTVVRKGGSAGTLTIDYATIDGTAIAGQDYTATSGTLTFNGGETSKTIQIPILDDAVTEPDETFTVALRNAPSLETLVAPSTVVVTIQDRNTIPIISQNAPSVVEGNTGTVTEALFTFTLSAATGRSVSADYATQNSSAFGSPSCSNSGTDYETISGTISFSPGNTSITIPVKICGDNSAEANEIFSLKLSSPVNAIVNSPQPVGRILDDDQLELLHDESGPDVNQAAALDSVLMLRDPFRVVVPEWFTTGPDRSTRVMFFVRGLQLNPGEFSSSVQVGLSSNSQFFAVLAEDVRAVPNADFAQVVIKLPDDMAPGTYTVFVIAHFRTSNGGTIRIAP